MSFDLSQLDSIDQKYIDAAQPSIKDALQYAGLKLDSFDTLVAKAKAANEFLPGFYIIDRNNFFYIGFSNSIGLTLRDWAVKHAPETIDPSATEPADTQMVMPTEWQPGLDAAAALTP